MTSATEFLRPRAVKVQPLGTNRARVTVEPFDQLFEAVETLRKRRASGLPLV